MQFFGATFTTIMFSRLCWKNVNAGKKSILFIFIVKYNRNIKLIFIKDFLKTYQILFLNLSNVIYHLYNKVSISYYGLYKCFTLLKSRPQSLNSCWVVNARCDLWKVGPGWSNGGAVSRPADRAVVKVHESGLTRCGAGPPTGLCSEALTFTSEHSFVTR